MLRTWIRYRPVFAILPAADRDVPRLPLTKVVRSIKFVHGEKYATAQAHDSLILLPCRLIRFPVLAITIHDQVKLHFRTLDFGQVTIGSANVRNLAITNTLAHAVLAELLDVEEQAELQGSRPLAQVVPAGATAGFDVHFKCSTEQVREGISAQPQISSE